MKNVIWVRAPPGIFTRCSCGTAPNDVVMMISRSVGCHAAQDRLAELAVGRDRLHERHRDGRNAVGGDVCGNRKRPLLGRQGCPDQEPEASPRDTTHPNTPQVTENEKDGDYSANFAGPCSVQYQVR